MAQTKIWDGTKWVDYIMSSQIKLPLGSIGFSLDGILPEGAIAATGLELSREVYKDLWGFAQKGGETRLISEEAWQAELAANEGRFCRYYSTGNGATTFRIPYIACYLSGTAEAEKVGTYVTDTQRNITGSITMIDTIGKTQNSAGALLFTATNASSSVNNNGDWSNSGTINFDASRSVGAEHTGNEVKPKTAYVLYYIQAFSTIINSGTLDINDLAEDVSQLNINHQIKSFTDLVQIGLTNGIEQLQDIGKALPDNSQITYRVWEKDNHNHIIYPCVSGIFTMEKSLTFCRCFFNSITLNKQWQSAFDYRDEFYNEPTWELLAKNNKLSMPSNNKIIINLSQQNQAWTAPSDGWVWAIKVVDGNTVGSWCRCFNNSDPKQATFGTVFYSDYGTYGSNDLCGYIPVAKGTTLYFSWNQNAKIYFIPALNANMPVYFEDVRIYFKAVDSNNNIISGATFRVSIADDSGDIIILSGKTLSDGRYLVPQDKWSSLIGLDDSQLITCTMTKGTATGSVEYRASFFKESKIYDLPITLIEGGGAVHNINLQIPIGGNIKSNKKTAYAGDAIILSATPDVESMFLNFTITNLITSERKRLIENPATYIMPDSDISVEANFDIMIPDPETPIDPIPPSLPLQDMDLWVTPAADDGGYYGTFDITIPAGVNVIYVGGGINGNESGEPCYCSMQSSTKSWFSANGENSVAATKYIGVTPLKKYRVTVDYGSKISGYGGSAFIRYSKRINGITPNVLDY